MTELTPKTPIDVALRELAKDVAVLADTVFQVCYTIRCLQDLPANELTREANVSSAIANRWSNAVAECEAFRN